MSPVVAKSSGVNEVHSKNFVYFVSMFSLLSLLVGRWLGCWYNGSSVDSGDKTLLPKKYTLLLSPDTL